MLMKNYLYRFFDFRILGIHVKVWEGIFSAISVRSYLGYAWVGPRTDILLYRGDPKEEKGETVVI